MVDVCGRIVHVTVTSLQPTQPKSLVSLLPFILMQQTLGALAFPIARYGLNYIEPFAYAMFRFALASALLLGLTRLFPQGPAVERRDWWRIAGLGFLIIPLNQTGYLWGQSLTAAGHGSILFATTPIWVFLLATLALKEPLRWRRGLGIAIALTGAFVIVTGGAIRIGKEYLTGDLIILVSVWAWAAYTIWGKPLAEKYGALRTTAYTLAVGSLMYLPFGVFRTASFDYAAVPAGAWYSIIYMAAGTSVLAYVLWYWVLKHMEASRLAVFSNIQPIIATTVAYFALGEVPGLSFLVGSLIVLSGVILTEVPVEKVSLESSTRST